MTLDPTLRERLAFLVRVVRRERDHLEATDKRLFAEPFTSERARKLGDQVEEAERVEAFASRFGRLQDTIGDKLLPVHLAALGEDVGATIDNLDRAEKLNLVPSTDDWLAMRRLRNQMVHEYIEHPAVHTTAIDLARDLRQHVFATLYHATALHEPDTRLVTADERYYTNARNHGHILRLPDLEFRLVPPQGR